jgi:hypothetical protein
MRAMTTFCRLSLLLIIALAVPLAAAERAPLVADDLHGAWELDTTAVTAEQQDAAAAAQAVDGFGLVLSLRTARIIFGDDDFTVGMWRLENATADAATLVVQPKGGAERRFQLSVDGKRMQIAEAPGKLPLIKTR